MAYWASFGVARYKLLMGIPLYGMSYQLAFPFENGVGAPALGPGKGGSETRMEGYLSYYEVSFSSPLSHQFNQMKYFFSNLVLS